MSSLNLPLTWPNKKNSPELEAFLKQFGTEYCMTAEEINQLRDSVNEMAVIQQSTFLGAAEPSFVPAGFGRAYWVAVKPGTYPNHGNVIVGANEIAFIIRDAVGGFSISKTPLGLLAQSLGTDTSIGMSQNAITNELVVYVNDIDNLPAQENKSALYPINTPANSKLVGVQIPVNYHKDLTVRLTSTTNGVPGAIWWQRTTDYVSLAPNITVVWVADGIGGYYFDATLSANSTGIASFLFFKNNGIVTVNTTVSMTEVGIRQTLKEWSLETDKKISDIEIEVDAKLDKGAVKDSFIYDPNSVSSSRLVDFLNANIEALTKILKIASFTDSFYLSDDKGNVIFRVDSDGVKSKKYIFCDSNGNMVGSINKELFQTIYADKDDSNVSGVVNNYKGQFLITDTNGNVIFKVDENGASGSQSDNLIYQQKTPTIAKVSSSLKYPTVFFKESKFVGKKMLAIGDSLTAALKWQVKSADILGSTYSTHALGGIGLVAMVDGTTGSNGTIAPLNSTDVTGIDSIVILGPYNNRNLMSTIGLKTDMHPAQSTLWGQMNYVFKRIYQELATANNTKCKIFFAGVHAYGAYSYNDKTAYQEYPVGSGFNGKDFAEKLKEICGWNGIEYIDLFNNSGINSYTWNTYQASSQPNSTKYIGYINGRGAGISDPFPDLSTLNGSIVSSGFVNGDTATVTGFTGYYTYNGTSFVPTSISGYYPWMADQLHCNDEGYYLIGNFIASKVNSFFNN